MSQRSAIVYLYDGSLEGFLTAVFESYAVKPAPVGIAEERGYQQPLGDTPVYLATDYHKAERVRQGIVSKLGGACYDNLFAAFLSAHEDKEMILLRYLAYAFKMGRAALSHLAVPAVAAFEDILGKVYKEQSRMMQFLRFAEMDNGIYYAKINPKDAVLALIMGHFAGRMNTQPFVIYDETHREAGVYDLKGWYLTPVPEGVAAPQKSRAEGEWQLLWKSFYDTVAIKERANHSLRRSHLPLRLWKNMVEFTLRDTPRDGAPLSGGAVSGGPLSPALPGGSKQPLLPGGQPHPA